MGWDKQHVTAKLNFEMIAAVSVNLVPSVDKACSCIELYDFSANFVYDVLIFSAAMGVS